MSEPQAVTPAFVRAVPWMEDRARNAVRVAGQAGARVIWDRHRSGWETFLAAMAAAGDGPSIHLEDDITLTSGWRPKIEAEIALRPGMVQQFFSLRNPETPRGRPGEQAGRNFLMTQCFYLPAGYAAQIRVFLDSREGRELWSAKGLDYDSGVAEWLRRGKLKYWMASPSLVQHRPWKTATPTVSRLGTRPTDRQSPTFLP